MDPLPRGFYERGTLIVARELLGKALVRRVGGDVLMGRIVETEAYTGSDDPASHAYRGRTKRNAVMFSGGGLAYVYLSYGTNFCLNATTEPSGTAGAVLIRAVEPVQGLNLMTRNRPLASNTASLTNGPGKLCQAMQITRELNGTDLTQDGAITIEETHDGDPFDVVSGARVGISKATLRPWRFYINGNPFVSRPNLHASLANRESFNIKLRNQN